MEATTFRTGTEDEENAFDRPRMMPSQYIPNKDFRMAIVEEINGITEKNDSGCVALICIHKSDQRARGKKKIRSTLAVRRKNPTKIKARLCIRGDTIGIFDHTCAPAPYRSALKTFLFVSAQFHFHSCY